MNTQSQLTFDLPLVLGIIGCMALVAILLIAWYAWRRSGYSSRVGMLELLRVIIALLVVVTLGGPEWRQVYQPTERPSLVILRDTSLSMQTQDMPLLDEDATGPRRRAEWVDAGLATLPWSRLEEQVEVVHETFASSDPAMPGEQATDIHAALLSASRRHANLRAIVLLTDGDWNQGDAPVEAGIKLRLEQVPVYAVSVGSEQPLPDIEVASLDPPSFSVVGKSLQVPFRLRSSLPVDHEAKVVLEISATQSLEKSVVIPAFGELSEVFVWTPDEVEQLQLSLQVEPHPLEIREDNNRRAVAVEVKAESLRVLVVETVPRWEYRFLRNALERDPGVDVSCLLFHPAMAERGGGAGYVAQFPSTDDELAAYDVVFLGDVGTSDSQLSLRDCERLKGLVQQQASGLILMPGMRGYQQSLLDSALQELYPVELDASTRRGFGFATPSQLELTTIGQQSLLTKLADSSDENFAIWQSLPGFHWRAPVVRSRAGSEVLAIDATSRAPLLVTRSYGTGKVLFMGTDSAWRWRKGVEDKYHYRFWGQVARWMAYQRQMAEGDSLRMFYTPDRPTTGNVVTLHATVLSADGAPLSDTKVEAEVTTPEGEQLRLQFQAEGKDWGLYTARFSPERPGSYAIALHCRETAAVLRTQLQVVGAEREVIGRPMRLDVLAELSQVTRGELLTPERLGEIADLVLELPAVEPIVRRQQIWASPWWAATLMTLLAIFWSGRKMIGAI